MNIGLLIIRLIVGLTLVAHGAQKLFGRLGGGGLAGTGEMLEKMGLRPGKPYALLAGLTEAGGGLMLAAGLLTPVASAAIIAVMAVAIEVAHASKGFFAHKGGWEYALVMAASALGLAFTGPGAYSLDSLLGLTWDVRWGLRALIAGLVADVVVLLARSLAQRFLEHGHTPQPQA